MKIRSGLNPLLRIDAGHYNLPAFTRKPACGGLAYP
jgi:hypothetical protein